MIDYHLSINLQGLSSVGIFLYKIHWPLSWTVNEVQIYVLYTLIQRKVLLFQMKAIIVSPKKVRTLQRAWSEHVSPSFFCGKVDTCILIATGLPSFRTPRWTWPIDAAAKGFMSNSNSRSRHLAPNSLTRTFWEVMQKFVIIETIRIFENVN